MASLTCLPKVSSDRDTKSCCGPRTLPAAVQVARCVAGLVATADGQTLSCSLIARRIATISFGSGTVAQR